MSCPRWGGHAEASLRASFATRDCHDGVSLVGSYSASSLFPSVSIWLQKLASCLSAPMCLFLSPLDTNRGVPWVDPIPNSFS